MTTTNETPTYTGSCHCGAVRFEADIDLSKGASRCNCTMCMKTAKTAALIKPAAFRLLAGEDVLVDYHKEGHPTYWTFCRRCGIHAFGRGDIPEVGGAYVSVNLNCLDDVDVPTAGLAIHYWDGRHDNWQAGMRDQPWPVRT